LIFTVVVLGLIFFALTYLGISQARQSLLKVMVDEGRALVESLTLSSTNAIQAELLLESLSEGKFVDLARTARQRLNGVEDAEKFRKFCEEYNLLSLDILDSSEAVIGSDKWAIGYVPEYPQEVTAELHDVQATGERYRSAIVSGDSSAPLVQYFIYSVEPNGNIVVMSAAAAYMDQIMRQIGIGYLIRRISGQAGIVYIVLQGRDGIIFSSRTLPPMLSIASDSFLDNVMKSDTISWRITEFEGADVLEIAKHYESVSYPPGVYRVSMDMDEFHQISDGYDRQIIAVAIALFMLTLLVVAVVAINQNYFILDRTFQQMRSLTESVFDRLSSGVLAIGSDGKIIAVNKAFTEITGLTDAAVGAAIADLSGMLPFAIPSSIPPGERLVSFEQKVRTASGQDRSILLGFSALPSDAGGGTVVLIHDITVQKRLEEENRRRERLSEMGDMAAGVAHEIRNPLNAISIAAQRLEMEFTPPGEKDEYDRLTKNILSEAGRLNQILTRFLDLAKVRASEEKPVDLGDAIQKAIDSIMAEGIMHHIMINYRSTTSAIVRGSVEKYQQVFINLIKNSMQAMPSGGMVEIIVTPQPDKRVEVTLKDSGPGFSAEALAKIFQPYFTTKADGSGLGLALAYKTITDYGGEISAANDPSGGAMVRMLLPMV